MDGFCNNELMDLLQDGVVLHDRRGVRPGLWCPPDGVPEGRVLGPGPVLTLYKWFPRDQCFGS